MTPGTSNGRAVAAIVVPLLFMACNPAMSSSPAVPTQIASLAAPTSTPSPPTAGTPQLTSNGAQLDPGTYGLGDFGLDVEITVPDGWAGDAAPGLAGVNSVDIERETLLDFWIVAAVFDDPCAVVPPMPSARPTIDELAEAVLRLPDLEVQQASTAQLDGYDARYVELLAPIDTECDPYRMWLGPNGSCRCMFPAPQHFRLWFLEVDSVRFMIEALDTPPHEGGVSTTPKVLAELQSIIDSIDIKPAS